MADVAKGEEETKDTKSQENYTSFITEGTTLTTTAAGAAATVMTASPPDHVANSSPRGVSPRNARVKKQHESTLLDQTYVVLRPSTPGDVNRDVLFRFGK